MLENFIKAYRPITYSDPENLIAFNFILDRKNRALELSFMDTPLDSGKALVQYEQGQYRKLPARVYRDMKTSLFIRKDLADKWNKVPATLKRALHSRLLLGYSLRVYGHGEGGALAMLAYEDAWNFANLNDLDLNKIKGYSFGSPRVFTQLNLVSLKKRFKNFYHIINVNDLIPKIGKIFGYRNYGVEIKLGKRDFSKNKLEQLREHFQYEELITESEVKGVLDGDI